MSELRFLVPLEEQEQWKTALEHAPETEATMALLHDIEQCLDKGDFALPGDTNSTLTAIFARLGKALEPSIDAGDNAFVLKAAD